LNNKAITFIKNFSYSLSSNLISIIISSIIILIVPKLIGVKEYGYWQLYLFYSSYVGFLHFGWNDGIYLRYGGKEYRDLDKNLFFSQFWMLVISQICLGIIILVISFSITLDENRLFILSMTAICMFIVNVRYMLIYILQTTNRIKEYAQITMLEKVLYCILILFFLFVGVRQYKLLIIIDLIGKLISLFYSIYCCRDMVFRKASLFTMNIKEMFENISVGIKLMFANIASMLIIGIVQFGIERTWDVATFGKIALVLSVSNLLMVFINAVGIIMFPVLRRADIEDLPKLYSTIRTILMAPLLGILVIYYPVKILISMWLPQYAQSFEYMALIFPVCIFEGKMALLINSYLKTLRKEKLMMQINWVVVILSVILTSLLTLVFKNLTLSVISIVVLLAFRCVLAESYLSKGLKISVLKDIVLEIVMSLVFIITGWFNSSIIGISIYLLAYVLYLFIKKGSILSSVNKVKILSAR
jgi:O-antigen/teichoic acid export membrane protein